MSLRDDIKNAKSLAELRVLYRGAYRDIKNITDTIDGYREQGNQIGALIAEKKAELKALGGNGDLEDLFVKRIGELGLDAIK